ncbi:Aro80p [Lachancea thermotolerans CBS 6340]|uniref:KLTH0G03718p n=1 Tax=Lachancea thermotolerans (strain ATCC 56472 / CBS 6340 / NRRL Y-8284) TaxID=559295 RepID=C5DLU9_LACTC|nr:KLTH0G03718p [Lachancea thermotolerans CBS 6340]CAR24760.1 KLTH0G03718p [Lachancea thermotolerans CBS 6340]
MKRLATGNDLEVSSQKYRRGYKACLNCRSRKTRCDLGPPDSPRDPPCVRCKRERKECVFLENSKRGGRKRIEWTVDGNTDVNATARFEAEDKYIPVATLKDTTSIKEGSLTPELNSMHNALEFLAKAAGSAAKEDSRSRIPSYERQDKTIREKTYHREESPNQHASGSKRASLATPGKLIEKLSDWKPGSLYDLGDVEYIGGHKLLTEKEATRLIDLFFLNMHPFFPYIPFQLRCSQELKRYPILLCAILTISARYHNFAEHKVSEGERSSRNIEVHDRLWIYCQRLISQSVWAEASTRSVGTILAFLLFTEWNPRAIHWHWTDYANDTSLSDISRRDYHSEAKRSDNTSLTGMGAMRRSDRMAWMLTGTAVRLAQDMGFMNNSPKIFTALHITETQTAMNMNQRSILSQSLAEVSLNGHDGDSGLSSACIEEIFRNEDSKRRWKSYTQQRDSVEGKSVGFCDNEKEFLIDEYAFFHNEDSDAYRDLSNLGTHEKSKLSAADKLLFTPRQRAKVELLRIMSIGYEAIYYKDTKLTLIDHKHKLAVLGILAPMIKGWHNTYKHLLVPFAGGQCPPTRDENKNATYDTPSKIDSESLISDYFYCQLYIYSLALQIEAGTEKDKKPNINELTKSAKYVELAYNAAKEVLHSAIRVHKLRALKYMPVRWAARIIRAVAFVVRCYMTLTGSGLGSDPRATTILAVCVISAEEIIEMIQKAAITLREASPDELHLCSRFSTVLMFLCTEMKRKQHSEPQNSELRRSSSHSLHNPTDAPARMPTTPAENYAATDFAIPAFLETPHPSHLPSELEDWFCTSDDVGLDFVEPWAEMLEQQFINNDKNMTFENLYNEAMGYEHLPKQ